MHRSTFAELQLSQLMLGTVQFGLSYGIANRNGQPSYEESRDILAAAYEGGVNCLDTAASYGSSEEVVGRALQEIGIREEMVVVSKVPMVPPDLSSHRIDEYIEKSVRHSLERLQLEVLPVCLFHHEQDGQYLDSLLKVREKGMVQHVGVSGLTPEGTLQTVNSGVCEAMQIPTSILDQSFREAGVFSSAQQRGIALFVRSVFLQGLLLMPEDQIQPEFATVTPVLAQLRSLAAEADLTMSELAVRYVLGIPGVTCILTGVESVSQIRENIRVFDAGALVPELMADVEGAVPELPEHVTRPYLWGSKVPAEKFTQSLKA